MAFDQCSEMVEPPVAFDERHPDQQLTSWSYLARKTLDAATCVHQADAVNLFAISVSDVSNSDAVSFAVDFDNGDLYNETPFALSFSREDLRQPVGTLREPDAVLTTEAMATLREAIDQYRVLDWPFREPGEPVTDGEYTVRDGFQLAVVFYDDTGSVAERPEKSDADMVGFLNWAQSFLTEQTR